MFSFTHIVLLVTIFGVGFAQDCYSNVAQCNSELQALLLNTSAFPFGSNFANMCSYTPPPGNCRNPNPSLQSIYAKVFDTSDTTELSNRVSGVTVLDVAYNTPEESYQGCGHMFHVPALKNARVDPLRHFRHSMRSLMYRPNITWTPANFNEVYSVAMINVQFSYIHAMYVNCIVGNWHSCQSTVYPYNPPGAFWPAENVYVFLLFRHNNNQMLDAAQASARLQSLITQEPGVPFSGFVNFRQFWNTYQGILGNPVQANVLSVFGDPYNAEAIRKRYSLDVCPWYISQLDAFHTVIARTGMDAVWSNPRYTQSLYSNNSYLTSLSLSLKVTYHTDSFNWKTCCHNDSISMGSYVADPFSNHSIHASAVRHSPWVEITPTTLDWTMYESIRAQTYLFMMVDVTHALEEGTDEPFLRVHWIVANVKNAEIPSGKELMKYAPPAPPATGAYMFLLFNQPTETLNEDAYRAVCGDEWPCYKRLSEVLNALGVSNPVGLTWFLAHRDTYVDMLYYSVYNINTEHEICRGRPGYANPCPVMRMPMPMDDMMCDGISPSFNFYHQLVLMGVSLLALVYTINKQRVA